MVLNDVYDAAVDAVERPERPIPSRRIPLSSAKKLGWSLLAGGVAAAWLTSWAAETWRPGLVGSALAGCILLYDIALKHFAFGPVVMGGCRLLNVLLGMSLSSPWQASEWAIAIGIGTYIAGVTWLACNEAQSTAVRFAVRTALRAIIVIDAAIVLGYCGPFWGCAVLSLLAPMLLLERWANIT
jgi:4-hydroxybenzoate polyprenyltransferase